MSTAATWTGRVWAGIVSLFQARSAGVVAVPVRKVEPVQIRLRELVQVRASRPRSSNTFPVMLEAISERGFLFKTQSSKLAQGEVLVFDALLRGVGLVKLTGAVAWLLRGSVGFSGEIRLQEGGESSAAWLRYVELQSKGLRGSII